MKNFIITLSAICIFLFAYTNSLRAQCYHGMDINVVELNGVCSNPSNTARVKIEAIVASGCETYYAYGITGITFDGQSIEFPERTPSTFSGLPPGVYVASFYTLTDTDGNITGNLRRITSKNFSVNVVDVIPPVAKCKDISVQLDANGLGAITASDIDDGSSDNCGIASMEITSGQSSYRCEDLDNNFTVELTVADNLGRIAACSANVTVADDNYHCNRPPVAVCQDITVSADGNCQGNAPAAYFDGGSNDLNLDNLSFSVEPVAPYAVGTSTVTLTVSDPSGESDNCTATITVVDDTAPILECPLSQVLTSAPGNCGLALSNLGPLRYFDNCDPSLSLSSALYINPDGGLGTLTLSSGVVPDFQAPVGSIEIVYNLNGYSESCSFTITIEENDAPLAVCQDITVQLDGANNASVAAADIYNGPETICDLGLSLDKENFSCLDIGENTVTLTVTDNNSNSSSCEATVVVADDDHPCNQAPMAVCQDITVSAYDNCQYFPNAEEFDGGSTDPEGDLLTFSIDYLGLVPLGVTNIMLTVDDGSTQSTCSASITVEDNTPPTIDCPDNIVETTHPLSCGRNIYFSYSSFDNCQVKSTTFSHPPGSNFTKGTTVVTGTATDKAGNTAACSFTVTVLDKTKPELECQDATVQLDANGEGSITTSDMIVTATDNCSIASSSISSGQTDYSCEDLGQTFAVELTLTDNAGLSATCSANVTVADDNHPCNQAPMAVCQDITVSADGNCQGNAGAADFDGGSNDPDLDNLSFSVDPAGPYNAGTTAVTLIVGDGEFSDACSATITVEASPATIQMAAPVKLWPPDYAYQTFTVEQMATGLSGDCAAGSLDDVWISQATSDELEDDPGTQDGNTLNDMVVSADCRSIQVRKERMGGGNGRVYTVRLAIADAGGNISYAEYKISVPRWAWGWNSEAVEDDAMYTVECGAGSGSAVIAQNEASFPTVDLQAGKMDLRDVQLAVYPNPFERRLNVSFQLAEPAFTTVEIYDLQGRRIRQLHNAQFPAGDHRLGWDGADASGAPTLSGLYLIQLQTGNETIYKKALLQRR